MDKILVSYSQDFASFFIKNTKNFDNIKNIILFGSVSRGDASEESDIDILIELYKSDKNVEKEIKQIKKDFYESMKYKQYWKLLDVHNEFNILSGTFEEWKELKNSIVSNGITLYGKFNSMPEGKNVALISWKEIKPNSKRVLFNKKVFGYNRGKKFCSGLMDIYQGYKLGKGAVMASAEIQNNIEKLLKKFNIKYTIIKAVVYT